MTDRLGPARQHINQGRLDLAEPELHAVLAGDPENGLAHALLAICLTNTDRHTEALAETDEALRWTGASSTVWLIRSAVLGRAGKTRAALDAANEAIRLAPGGAEGLLNRADVLHVRGDLAGALRDADAALAINPAHVHAHDLRARLLTRMGRGKEAEAAGREALRLNPEAAGAHAALGWQMLHSGDPKRAQAEFREALRLDPFMSWARAGLVEALKARNPVYRPLLALLLWMVRSRAARLTLLAGLLITIGLVRAAETSDPALRPYAAVGALLCLLLLPAVFIAGPLFNSTLWLNRGGRHLLSDDERHATVMVVACLAAGAGLAAVWAVTGNGVFGLAGVSIGLLSMAAGVAFSRRPGITPRLAAVLGAASVPLMVVGLALAVTGYGVRAGGGSGQNGLPELLVVAPGFVGFVSRSIVFRILSELRPDR